MQGFFTYNLDKTTKKKEIRFSLKGEWESSCACVQAALCLCAASRPQTWAVCNKKTWSRTTTVAVLCSMLPSCGRTARLRRRSKFLQWMTAVKARGRFPNTVDDVISYGKCVFSVVDFFFFFLSLLFVSNEFPNPGGWPRRSEDGRRRCIPSASLNICSGLQ